MTMRDQVLAIHGNLIRERGEAYHKLNYCPKGVDWDWNYTVCTGLINELGEKIDAVENFAHIAGLEIEFE